MRTSNHFHFKVQCASTSQFDNVKHAPLWILATLLKGSIDVAELMPILWMLVSKPTVIPDWKVIPHW